MIESSYLKDDIKNIQQLMTIPTLKKFETKNLGRLLRLSKIRQYEAGEQIIKEGDTDPWLYFLLSGKVRIEKEGVQIATIDQEGEFFGEMRILDSLSRSASVFSEDKTVCLAVNTAAKEGLNIKDQRQTEVEFLLQLYRIFAEYMSVRLRLANEELIKCKKAGLDES